MSIVSSARTVNQPASIYWSCLPLFTGNCTKHGTGTEGNGAYVIDFEDGEKNSV